MARGPDGSIYNLDVSEEDGINETEKSFLVGLEKIIDGAMETLPRGDAFVYGIHQSISPGMVQVLTRRYLAAGWREADLSEGETGAFDVYLRP